MPVARVQHHSPLSRRSVLPVPTGDQDQMCIRDRELLVLFMLQETPGLLPTIFGSRPLLVLPAVLTIALFEKELPAMIFGIVGGLLLDFGLSGVMGFHALILAVLCFLVSLLAQVYLQVNIVTAVFMGIWTAGIAVSYTHLAGCRRGEAAEAPCGGADEASGGEGPLIGGKG